MTLTSTLTVGGLIAKSKSWCKNDITSIEVSVIDAVTSLSQLWFVSTYPGTHPHT